MIVLRVFLSLLFEDRAAIRHDSTSVEGKSNMVALVSIFCDVRISVRKRLKLCVVKTVLMPVVFLDGRKEPKEARR